MSNIVEWYEKQSDRLRLIFVIISGVALATYNMVSLSDVANRGFCCILKIVEISGSMPQTKGDPPWKV